MPKTKKVSKISLEKDPKSLKTFWKDSIMTHPCIYVMIFIHFLIFTLPLTLILLTDNVCILIFLNQFFCITLLLNYWYGDCPITQIESHYGDVTMVDTVNKLFPIKYDIKNRDAVSLQWIFMAMMIAITKILLLFIKSEFKKYIN